jgi:hypothetical protein
LSTPVITATKIPDRVHGTGRLPRDLKPADISRVLGFEPERHNIDTDKVTMAWEFTVDGEPCVIWDYKGHRWSCYDPAGVLPSLFGLRDWGKMTVERFNELLDGPLSHPLPTSMMNRLALALLEVVRATGEYGARVLERFCRELQEEDEQDRDEREGGGL